MASLVHYSSTGNLLAADGSDRVEMIKQAADDIIKAKDSIIERYKFLSAFSLLWYCYAASEGGGLFFQKALY